MSISTIQLAARVARRSRTGLYSSLSMTEQEDVIAACNGALQRLFNAMPAYFKEQTQGFLLPAPQIIENIDIVQYGRTLTGVVLAANQIGQTIVIQGDQGWNQIMAIDPIAQTVSLLNPFMGPTGTTSATIYGNALYSTDYPFDRIIGNPIFANAALTPLMRTDMIRANGNDASWLFQQSVGQPQSWWTQVFGESQGKTPLVVLRFAPAPDRAYAVNVRLAFWPRLLTLADLQSARPVFVPDQFIHPSLIPMAIQEFMQYPSWLSRKDERQVDQKGKEAEQWAKNQLGQIGVPNNRVYTPIGY